MQVAEQLIIEQIQIGPMQNFAYLVGDRTTREVVVVDPAWDIPGLLGLIEGLSTIRSHNVIGVLCATCPQSEMPIGHLIQ